MNTKSRRISPNVSIFEAQEFPRTLQKLASLRDTPGHTKHQDLAPLRYRGLSPMEDFTDQQLKGQFSPLFAGFLQNTSQVVQNFHKFPPNFLRPIKSLPVGQSLQFFHVVESFRDSPWCAASRSSNHWQLASSQHRFHCIGSLHKDGLVFRFVLECQSQENDTYS